MLVSVGLPVDRAGDPRLLGADGIGEVARAAERAGFGAVFCTDHPAPDAAWLVSGGHPTVDPFVALAIAAAATTTLRVHTNLLVLGYRNPLLAAKAIATLDVASGGRSIVGVGVGYLQSEFAALGADFEHRGALADEALAAMVEAWRAEPLDLEGTGWQARQSVVAPAPHQQPHPPLWVGGNSAAAMARAVRFGAGWAPMPSPRGSESALGTPAMPDLAAFADGVERLHDLAAVAGRTEPIDVVAIPPSLSGFRGPRWRPDRALEEMALLADAGATGFVVNLPGESVAGYLEELEAFGETVMQRLPH